MKKTNTLYLIAIIALLSFNFSFAQGISDPRQQPNDRVVEQLNAPTKIWTNGQWEINTDGTRVWTKGCWKFEEKTFQQKSEIFRKKLNKKNKV